MGLVMDLVAGDSREILLVIAMDELASFDDRERFPAHLTFGGAIEPTWLDLFSQAVRAVVGRDEPRDFLDARAELDGPGDAGERTIERIDPTWISAIARMDDRDLDAVTGRWIDLLEDDLGEWYRGAYRIALEFARAADSAPSVLLAWSL